MPTDFQELKRKNNIVDVIGRHLHLDRRGTEHFGICPFHQDKHKSLQVNENKQIFKCFACGTGGDMFDFLIAHGMTIQEAVASLDSHAQLSQPEHKQTNRKERIVWNQIMPLFPPQEIVHYSHGKPNNIWTYRDAKGAVIGFVCRFNKPDGYVSYTGKKADKEVIPYTFCEHEDRREWRWNGFSIPRPIYGLHLLSKYPEKTVIIVEGEKCADVVNSNMTTAVAVAWPGGVDGTKYVDWSPIYGRKVIYWPDHDTEQKYGEKHAKAGQVKPWYEQPGNKAMISIDSMLESKCKVRKWLSVPDEYAHKWDAADKEWTDGEMRKFVLENIFDMKSIIEKIENDKRVEPETVQEVVSETMVIVDEVTVDISTVSPEQSSKQEQSSNEMPPELPDEDEETETLTHNPHFRFLGYINENGRPVHCFYPSGNNIIVKLTTSAMSKSSLLDIAPLQFWEHHFGQKRGWNIEAATNWLSCTSSKYGVFSEKYIRGRGAWHDQGRTIIHSGSQLIVDGEESALGKIDSRYIYEIGEPLGFSTAKPLTPKDASKLIDILRLVNWDRDINAYLLAGWCVVAPICGALKWRPHIWITGAAGTGKSWVFTKIVRKILGETALAVQGETSEAGVRQSIGHDAIPVVFDEMEGEDRKNQDRVQTILNLMRSASSEDGGSLVKGSSGGGAVSYVIRSCFAFASIGVSMSQQSDRSRVTLLGIKLLPENSPIRLDRWAKLQSMYDQTMTDRYVQGLQARTLSMVPVIIKNAQTFANAAASVIGAQRAGDQLGALLAGAYSLFSSSVISYEKALEWVKEKDWNEEKGLDQTRDEQRLFSYIMDQTIRVETSEGARDRQVGELIQRASAMIYDSSIIVELAESVLKRKGFKISDDKTRMIISNSSDGVIRMLKNTPWEKNHSRILMRLDGALSIESTTFASGTKSRAVSIPLSHLK